MAGDERGRDDRRLFRDEAERGARALGGEPRRGAGAVGFRGFGGTGGVEDTRGGIVDDGRNRPGTDDYARTEGGRGSGYGRFGVNEDARRTAETRTAPRDDRFGDFTRRVEGAHRGRGPKGYQRSDERIHDDVSDRLTDDGSLDASDIAVSVLNGEVTLSGRVDRREDKRRAEDLADHVSGVRHVQNNLRVGRPSEATGGAGASGTAEQAGAAEGAGIAGTQIGTGAGSGRGARGRKANAGT